MIPGPLVNRAAVFQGVVLTEGTSCSGGTLDGAVFFRAEMTTKASAEYTVMGKPRQWLENGIAKDGSKKLE
jgi:hypothetical protein